MKGKTMRRRSARDESYRYSSKRTRLERSRIARLDTLLDEVKRQLGRLTDGDYELLIKVHGQQLTHIRPR